ncbi:MAG TPA: cation:proton antiporter [Pyrinomonadaceae bacterium]|nr:cation:proton antiporter [Pyrinomonadaceae bacterium]
MSSQDFVKLSLQLATMLGFAIMCGEFMRRLKHPAVVGEMFGGIILGPTILGALAPSLYDWLFLSSINVNGVREAATKLGMLFFLFYAGLEVNLSELKTMRRKAILIGLIGTLVPIALGVGLVYALPRTFWGPAVQAHFLPFALFIGMNFANSANPVIARILLDLGLLHGPIGALIMSATVIDDLVNWILFAVILSDFTPAGQAGGGNAIVSVIQVGVFFVVVLGLGRWLQPKAMKRIRQHVAWPSGFIAVTALLVLFASSVAEALGIHAFLGAFLIGVALSEGDKGNNEAHDMIGHVVMSFAPIYFISMGMTTNFITNFDLLLVALILSAACVSKIGAVLLGAKAARMTLDREVWAIGFGLNARGATGIILAGVGLANGVIDARIFVALIVTALVTSFMAGPMMSRLLWHRQTMRVAHVRPAMEGS